MRSMHQLTSAPVERESAALSTAVDRWATKGWIPCHAVMPEHGAEVQFLTLAGGVFRGSVSARWMGSRVWTGRPEGAPESCALYVRSGQVEAWRPVLELPVTREIRAGDSVRHNPSGETWTVARVLGDWLEACGWPRTQARVADCTLLSDGAPEPRGILHYPDLEPSHDRIAERLAEVTRELQEQQARGERSQRDEAFAASDGSIGILTHDINLPEAAFSFVYPCQEDECCEQCRPQEAPGRPAISGGRPGDPCPCLRPGRISDYALPYDKSSAFYGLKGWLANRECSACAGTGRLKGAPDA